MDIPLKTPLGNIALALSGGGFRAAAFSLGTLSYLQHLKPGLDENGNPSDKPLLDHVHFIASTSGGTITASVYSMLRCKGMPFGDIYKKLHQALSGERLLTLALEKLNNDAEWDQPGNGKRRNLINAFAKAYDEELFAGETFGVYWNNDKPVEVCFNATEFRRGLPFRFQTDGISNTYELIGNYYIHFDNRQADVFKRIKLADILAASSCFPSGFEPILFPGDFTYKQVNGELSAAELRQALLVERYNKEITPLKPSASIGLMDGGITDNQGLDSTMYADDRRRNNNRKAFDLIMVTDVTSYFMDSWQDLPDQKPAAWTKKSLREHWNNIMSWYYRINRLLLSSVLLLCAGLGAAFFLPRPWQQAGGWFISGLSTCLVLLLVGLIILKRKTPVFKVLHEETDLKSTIKQTIPPINHFSTAIIDKLCSLILDTKTSVLKQMVMARISSVLTMSADVYLRHVRRLIYRQFYKDPQWKHRRCGNFIYELSKQNEASRKEQLKKYVSDRKLKPADADLLTASAAITTIAEEARCVGTTLWFDPNSHDKLKQVISCGQFSTCVNLLQYILLLENDRTLQLSDPVRQMLDSVKNRLVEDWRRFNENPCFLYEMYGI